MKSTNLPELIFDEYTFFTTINDSANTKATQKTTSKTTSKEMLIIEEIKTNNQITAKQMSINLNLTEEGVRYHLKKMKKAKIINYTGPAKGGHREIVNNEK